MPSPRMISNRPRTVLNTEQKIAFALLCILGFGGVVFGFRSFGSHLYRPIQEQFAKNSAGPNMIDAQATQEKQIEEQKKQDTDHDGLSDYDEFSVYKTSPYLTDSDSDGLDDKSEVFAGTDPNCPKGKACSASGEATNVSQTPAQDLLGGSSSVSAQDVLSSGKIQFQTKEDVTKFFQSATVSEIRRALVQSGMKQEEVDKLNDADLKKLFDQAILHASENGQFDSLTTQPK